METGSAHATGTRFEFEGLAKASTEKALLVEILDGTSRDGDEVWFPWSQIFAGGEVNEVGQSGTIAVTQWIAGKKDLIYTDGYRES